MEAKKAFRMPTRTTITYRTSAITNSFVNAIIPVVEPSEEEVARALEALCQQPEGLECVYCGDACTEWDHLNALVRNSRPTGYISEIRNLVPACGKCNQSKGNKPWREWMTSDAPKSPKSRGIPDLNRRIMLLTQYEARFKPTVVDLEQAVGKDRFDEYWALHAKLLSQMKAAQDIAEELAGTIEGRLQSTE